MRLWTAIAGMGMLAGCQQSDTPKSDAAANLSVPAEQPENRAAPGRTPADGAIAEGQDSNSIPPLPSSGRVSQFTPLDPATCKLIEQSDEGPYWRRRCAGVGGYAVEWTESDLRQNITVVAPSGGKTSLDLPAKVASGAFDRLGPRIEWRGPAGSPPDVLVVRVHVANDQGEDDGGHLAVARLKPSPCLVGVVHPRPDQSDKARALADEGGTCL